MRIYQPSKSKTPKWRTPPRMVKRKDEPEVAVAVVVCEEVEVVLQDEVEEVDSFCDTFS